MRFLQLRHIVLSCVELSGPYGLQLLGCNTLVRASVCVCLVKTCDLKDGSATATAAHRSRVVAAAFVAYCVFFSYLVFSYLGIPGLICGHRGLGTCAPHASTVGHLRSVPRAHTLSYLPPVLLPHIVLVSVAR